MIDLNGEGCKGGGREVLQVHRDDGWSLDLNGGGEYVAVLRIARKRGDKGLIVLNQHALQGEKLPRRLVKVCDLPLSHPTRAQEVARHLLPYLCAQPNVDKADFMRAKERVP